MKTSLVSTGELLKSAILVSNVLFLLVSLFGILKLKFLKLNYKPTKNAVTI